MAYVEALKYWNLGIQYLHLAQHVSDEVVKGGNPWVVVGEPSFPDTEYFEKTKWSDHMLATPLLFNFYHGIELMLKGFAALDSSKPMRPSHKLSDLAEQFHRNYRSTDVQGFLSKYLNASTVPSPLREFFKWSGTDVDKYYQALKYPESTDGKDYMHNELYYQSEWGVPFYAELRDDILAARQAFVRLGRTLKPT